MNLGEWITLVNELPDMLLRLGWRPVPLLGTVVTATESGRLGLLARLLALGLEVEEPLTADRLLLAGEDALSHHVLLREREREN